MSIRITRGDDDGQPVGEPLDDDLTQYGFGLRGEHLEMVRDRIQQAGAGLAAFRESLLRATEPLDGPEEDPHGWTVPRSDAMSWTPLEGKETPSCPA